MNIKEKIDYLNGVVTKVLPLAKDRLPELRSIYVDGKYFNDNSDITNTPVALYVVSNDKPDNYVEIEQELNTASGYLVSFVLGKSEFDYLFKDTSTLVEEF